MLQGSTTRKSSRMALKAIFIVSLLFMQACGWFESDSIREENSLFDKFKVITNKNDPGSGAQIVISYDSNNFEIIQDRCVELYYTSKELYVKCLNVDSVYKFVHIQLNEPSGKGRRPV